MYYQKHIENVVWEEHLNSVSKEVEASIMININMQKSIQIFTRQILVNKF